MLCWRCSVPCFCTALSRVSALHPTNTSAMLCLRFRNSMRVWNRSECQQHWLFPDTCQSEGGYTPALAYEMPGRPDNRLAFDYSDTMGVYEYFNVSFPCAGWIDPGCVQRKGYPACFNEAIAWLMWRDRIAHSTWQIALGESWRGSRAAIAHNRSSCQRCTKHCSGKRVTGLHTAHGRACWVSGGDSTLSM